METCKTALACILLRSGFAALPSHATDARSKHAFDPKSDKSLRCDYPCLERWLRGVDLLTWEPLLSEHLDHASPCRISRICQRSIFRNEIRHGYLASTGSRARATCQSGGRRRSETRTTLSRGLTAHSGRETRKRTAAERSTDQ